MTIKYSSTDRIHATLEHIDIDEDGCWICNYKTDTGNGYTRVGTELAHRWSYKTFVGELSDDELVLHKCDKRRCIKPLCLYKGDYLQNSIDMYDHGKGQKGDDHWMRRRIEEVPRGENQPNSKLTDVQADEIRLIYKTGLVSQRKLGAMYGISHTNVEMIVRDQSYKVEDR